jgi:hypothetical protein
LCKIDGLRVIEDGNDPACRQNPGLAEMQEAGMASAAFKARSPERDLKNDDLRIERLDKTLEEVIGEVRSERNGLRARYLSSPDNSVRPLEMADNFMSDMAEDTLEALRLCVTRLKSLDAQENILRQMQMDLARLQGNRAE